MTSTSISSGAMTAEEAQETANNAIHSALRYHGDIEPEKTLGHMGMNSDYAARNLVHTVMDICNRHNQRIDAQKLFSKISPDTKYYTFWTEILSDAQEEQ